MPTDDEILERVQRRATVIRRRQRLMVTGAATAVVVALLGGAVIAGSVGDRRTPVDAAAESPESPDPTTTVARDDGGCDGATSTTDLGPGSPGPGGSPPASTDGNGTEVSSPSPTTSGPLPAQGDPAGVSPAESSIPPDDPPAASPHVVEATSTTCPLQVRVAAVHQPGSTTVDLLVTVTAEPGYDAQGFVAWETDAVDLGQVERQPGSCAADTDDAVAVQDTFGRSHTYSSAGPKEVTVTFWASRCEGPGHQVEVAVVVPL